jgi:pyruvate,water dikinase
MGEENSSGLSGMANSLIQDAINSMAGNEKKITESSNDTIGIGGEMKTSGVKKTSPRKTEKKQDKKDKKIENGDEDVGDDVGNKVDDPYVKWFSELSNKDVGIAGGKGASLSEMFNSKFPVPPGFVITAQAFDYYITKNKLKDKIKSVLEDIDMEETADLQKASKKIRQLIEECDIPADLESDILEEYRILSTEKIDEKGVSEDALNILKHAQEPIFVSVRSSATTEDLAEASFAGQQETFLNIKGERQLIRHVKKCFSSLYTPRAIYYREKQGFGSVDALLAVVIQKMVDSEKSGVVFSRDPVNLDENIAIEAVYGLGEGIVSGKIKPDHYLVDRELNILDAKVVDKKIAIVRTSSGKNETVKLNSERSKTQVLTEGQVKKIAEYAMKLEEHYGKPQDIEFAIEDKKVYIVQSRPITTLEKKTEASQITGNIILEGQSASPGVGTGTVKVISDMDDLHKIKKGDVLVTEMTNPDMVVAMQKSVAIVTDEGGMTSHAAIVSREMGIPCIVGTDHATKILKDGMKITVDGSSGNIFEGEVAETKAVEIKPVVETERIKLKVIVDLPDFAERAAETGIHDVGLTRLEGIIASSGKHPLIYEKENNLEDYTELLRKGLDKIAHFFNSMWVRASDIRTDEYGTLEGAPEREINPMLGFHGIRFSLKHPKILMAELEAIKKIAEKYPNKKFGIMFPQVISLEEVKEAKEYFDKIKTENMEFGVMIETPAAVQIIEDICNEGIDFISFGTNDLTQFTLGVDRGNEDVQYLYNEMHPSIFSQIKRVIGACRRNKVETSICGQAGSKKEMAEFLFKKGINSISVNADAAHDISILIRQLEKQNIKEPETQPIQEPVQQEQQPVQPVQQEIQQPVQPLQQKQTQQQEQQSQQPFLDKRKIKKLKKKLRRMQRKPSKNLAAIERTQKQIAEYEDNIGPIEPFNSLEEIEDKAEQIHENVEQENIEKLEEQKQIADKIEVKMEKIDQEKKDIKQEEENIKKLDKSDKNNPKNSNEKIGIYKPNSEQEQKYDYDFDED